MPMKKKAENRRVEAIKFALLLEIFPMFTKEIEEGRKGPDFKWPYKVDLSYCIETWSILDPFAEKQIYQDLCLLCKKAGLKPTGSVRLRKWEYEVIKSGWLYQLKSESP